MRELYDKGKGGAGVKPDGKSSHRVSQELAAPSPPPSDVAPATPGVSGEAAAQHESITDLFRPKPSPSPRPGVKGRGAAPSLDLDSDSDDEGGRSKAS